MAGLAPGKLRTLGCAYVLGQALVVAVLAELEYVDLRISAAA